MRIRAVAVLLVLVLAACAKTDARTGVPAFEMPEAWRAAGVQADTVREGTELYQMDDAGRAVRYLYRPQDTTVAPQVLLVMLVHLRSRYASVMDPSGPLPDTIGGTADSLVVVGLPQGNPFPSGTPDAAKFDSLNLNLEQVRALFRR